MGTEQKTKTANRQSGDKAENQAAKFLKSKGYKILHKNYSTTLGEIDIIAHHIDTLVFVEVKARSSTDFGNPSEFVGEYKQRRIAKTACQFLSRHQIRGANVRFDVIEVYLTDNKIEHIENAFESYLDY